MSTIFAHHPNQAIFNMNLPPLNSVVHLLIQHNRHVVRHKAYSFLAMDGILLLVGGSTYGISTLSQYVVFQSFIHECPNDVTTHYCFHSAHSLMINVRLSELKN